MKDFVSKRRVSVVAALASLLTLWAIIVVPGGPAWPGLMSMCVVAVLLAATARLALAGTSPASMSDVIHGIEGEKTAAPVPVTARSPGAR
jgi:hypothetical protein